MEFSSNAHTARWRPVADKLAAPRLFHQRDEPVDCLSMSAMRLASAGLISGALIVLAPGTHIRPWVVLDQVEHSIGLSRAGAVDHVPVVVGSSSS